MVVVLRVSESISNSTFDNVHIIVCVKRGGVGRGRVMVG